MKAVALSHNEYYTTKEGNVGRKFNIIYGDMKFIPRADNASKSLSDKAKLLASHYSYILNSSESDIVTVRPESISAITERKTDQNNNLHKQLKNIFNIKYYQAFEVNDRKLRDVFVISYTENGREILENPGKFYSEFAQEKSVFQPKKFGQAAEKIRPHIDYIEEENNNLDSALTNFNDCDNNQQQDSLQLESIKSDFIYQASKIGEQKTKARVNSKSNTKVESKEQVVDEEQKTLKHWMSSITEADLVIINQKAERFYNSKNKPFNMGFLHKLIDKLSSNTKQFKYKNAVISYLAQALKYEKTPSEIGNRSDFRFLDYQENYLDSVEQSSNTDMISQLRRKISGAFDKITAFNILTHYYLLGVQEEKYDHEDGYIAKRYIFRLRYRQKEAINLSEHQKEILLNEVQAVFGNHVDAIICLPKTDKTYKNRVTSSNKSTHSNDQEQQIRRNYTSPTTHTLWGRIRTHLIKMYHDGQALDYSWFSKLSIEQIDEANNFILKVPTEFFKSYIKSHFLSIIQVAAGFEKSQIVDIEVGVVSV